ncbi:translation initiation factor IF-2 N-terminal domain-containing protein [Aetokthonos hydrillicola Thurmond2011]|jgi:RecA/RadA recombinase|uniref:Translation initiation factor IF-2 N-terminal domain-containing protein n=1 Tax=Aetokthonos hydrillicola Thurmond2011 TaxID=2712845 RepID=A0AAP5MDF1_9CYAN|nr:translation initiation factor IF-2 N-terminal domain-containing protein [Aetokthonos hydrillicola]MBO3459722.1 AAA family ATPase [Aetokthonos hydrillicola CCALA 1050]MBW4585154.1 translation initiation factor IF-2 N-terminal domain-containing protein [Aetokthonos hydrillicola CCALA 1050]MDR9899493.1 translation initiation factor IF-2 N-terminal domain-containing protein [Aetokthonos hydrillicola Thurmond2011]
MNDTKIRIYELSRELKLDNKRLLELCVQLNIAVKSHNSSITESEVERIRVALNKTATPSQSKSLKRTTKWEDWGYVFVGSTIDSLIRNLDGEAALKSYPEFSQRREYANQLMHECVGQKPCLFYVRRKGSGKEAGEELWELTIATDKDDVKLPPKLEKLGKTLSLLAAVSVYQDGYGGLRLLSVRLLQRVQGHADSYSVPCRLRLLANHQHHIDIPSSALARMANIPVCGSHVPTEDQLKAWKAFLQIEENIAKARQFCVPFIKYNYGSGGRRITFEINGDLATLDGSPENPLEFQNFWERVKRAKNEDIKLFETAPTGKNWRNSSQLGCIEEVDPRNSIIRVRIERDLAEYMATGRYQLPVTGFLCFEAAGDIQQIRRKKEALEQLKQGYTQNPYLGDFLFDATHARSIQKTVQLQPEELLLSSANSGQKAAVETVLAAKDLVLIQGPPGTGKTTVIAEICYQVALRGGRTLIASQANLAVDNALSRLVHNPVIRAVRKGRAEKVGEEGQPFLEDNVIRTWLQNTATNCDQNLSKRRETVDKFRQSLEPLQQFLDYLKAEEDFQQKQKEFQKNQANIAANYREQESIYRESAAKKSQVESLIVKLERLLNAAPNINWEEPEIVNFLPLLKPYTKDNSLVASFVVNVSKAIQEAAELGFVRPSYGAFGLAVWLRETVADQVSEFKAALGSAENAMIAISETATLVQAFRENSGVLSQLQRDYLEFLNKEQTLKQAIQNCEQRKREIDLVINVVKEWKSTANTRLYQILSKSRQNNQFLTEESLKLPVRLLSLARSSKLALLEPIYKDNKIDYLPDWMKLRKALSFEAQGGFTNLQGKQYKFGDFLHTSLSQIPMVVSSGDRAELSPGSDRQQWQEIAKKFLNYRELDRNQRQELVEKTQEFLSNMQQAYGDSWEANNIESSLNRITQELLESILTNARQCVFPIKAENEQQLKHQQNQFNEIQKTAVDQQQILTLQEQVETACKEAELKLGEAMSLLQDMTLQKNLPEQLRILAEQYISNQSYIWEEAEQFSSFFNSFKNRILELEKLIDSLDTFNILEVIKNSLKDNLLKLEEEHQNIKMPLEKSQSKLRELEKLQTQPPEILRNQRDWWQETWQLISDKFKPDPTTTDLFNVEFLHKVKNQFDSWQEELQQEETYLNRYQHFVQDWISKLRNASEEDDSSGTAKGIHNDLRQIYLDNANVIGITCVQAASRSFSEEFKYFDVVIIDEVSKCTPPELLIPALKGKKLVMVGDHRQLPPMLDSNTVEEVAHEIGSTKDELQFLEESLFKSQFEAANESIKQMLTTQYRMHPSIMGAINQFYDGKLECGIIEPDKKRAHNLTGEIIQNYHHLIWLATPIGNQFQEQREGTSFFNVQEIDVIERLCQQIESSWAARVANGEPKKEIAVITFYGAQLRKIDERLKSELYPSLQIRTGTVDRFQGMERPVVIVSMVRNNNNRDVGFAKKPERVNVAFSRAQELLVIVGCHDLFTQVPGKVGNMYSEVANVVHSHGGFVDVSGIIC